MNNIFYEFLEKNKLDDVIDDLPINENFNLPFVDKNALQPLRIDLVMYPIRVNNVMYNCYISSVPKPLLYFTLKKSKAILDIATQEQILQALVSGMNKTLKPGTDYVIIKSPKTLAPVGKGFITGDAISWKKGVWQFIRMAIEKGSKANIQSKITVNAPSTSGTGGTTTSSASSDSSNGQFDAKVIRIFQKTQVIGFKVLSNKISVGDTIEITKDNKKISGEIATIQINQKTVDYADKGQTCGVKFKDNSILSNFSEGDLVKIKKESNSVTQSATDSAAQTNSNDANQSSSQENKDEINHIKQKLSIGRKYERYLKVYKDEKIKSFINLVSDEQVAKATNKLDDLKSFEEYAKKNKETNEKTKKEAISEIISMYPEIKKILLAAGYNGTKTINDFLLDYKTVSSPEQIKKVDWFYENYVNKHFTLKRIFNS